MSFKHSPITDNPTNYKTGKHKNSEPSREEYNKYRWLNRVYSQMSIHQKISLPFILMFLATWFLGTSAFGYYFSRSLEQKQKKIDDIEALGQRILRDFDKNKSQL
jgi:hypothetical protein